jgi:uncharacterized protein YkwD
MTRSKTLIVLVVLAAVLVAGTRAAPSADAASLRHRMLVLINRVRARHELHQLRLNVDLSHVAQRHSRRMANQDRIFHTPHLRDRLSRYNWSVCGENVGEARTLRRVRRLWMKSPDHRFNMLLRAYRHIGLGVVFGRHRFWVTAIFYG